MIISDKAVQRIMQIVRGQEPIQRPAPKVEPKPKTDQVVLSEQGQLIRALQQRLAAEPEVRTEKVQALKEAIAKGEYRIPSELIAEKILDYGKEETPEPRNRLGKASST